MTFRRISFSSKSRGKTCFSSLKIQMIESKSEKNFFENLSVEIILTIFDYLTSIEIVFAFFDLNQRYRLIVHQRFQSNFPLTELDLRNSPFSLVQRFSQTILPRFQSMITSLEIGSQQQYGQIETFRNVAFSRLDNLTIRLIDPNVVTQILRTFLSHNSLQWFDKVSLFLDEITQIWDEWLPFCAIDIPVRQLTIEGRSKSNSIDFHFDFFDSFFRTSSLRFRSSIDDRLLHNNSFNCSFKI